MEREIEIQGQAEQYITQRERQETGALAEEKTEGGGTETEPGSAQTDRDQEEDGVTKRQAQTEEQSQARWKER